MNPSWTESTIFSGAGFGAIPLVKVYDPVTGIVAFEQLAFESSFTGGVRVSSADFNGDFIPDIVVAAGPGGGPRVRILNGVNGEVLGIGLGDFFAYEPTFTGGVEVATADVDGDGLNDLITAAGPGGGPRIRVFSGSTGATLADFFAFAPTFAGGVTLAADDFNGDGKADLVISAGPGGGNTVVIYDSNTGVLLGGPLGKVVALAANFTGGIVTTTGDLNGDGFNDLIVGSGPGEEPLLRTFSGADGVQMHEFLAADTTDLGGLRLSTAYVDEDGRADIIAGVTVGGAPRIHVYSGATQTLILDIPNDTAGNIAAGNPKPIVAFDSVVTEGNEQTDTPVTFTLTRIDDYWNVRDLIVPLQVGDESDTAEKDHDYIFPAELFFPAGVTKLAVTLQTVNDLWNEVTEVFTVTLPDVLDYVITGASSLLLSVHDKSSSDTLIEPVPPIPPIPPPPPPPEPPPVLRPTGVANEVWNDANANGRLDDGEVAIPGAIVGLYNFFGGYQQTTTDNNGNYYFELIPNVPYRLKFSLPSGPAWVRSPQYATNEFFDSNAHITTGFTGWFAIPPEQVDATYDAGFYQVGSVGNFVWLDENGDGKQTTSEPGLEDVHVELHTFNSSTPFAETDTDANGNYSFVNVPAGEYYLIFDNSVNGWNVFTDQNKGTKYVDSDVNQYGITGTLVVSATSSDITIDCGIADLSEDAKGDLDIVDSNLMFVDDSKEETPGGWVAVNNDNDNYNFIGNSNSTNQKYDKYENTQVIGENDLIKIVIHDLSSEINRNGEEIDGTFKLKWTSSKIKVWRHREKNDNEVMSGVSIDMNGSNIFWVEGVDRSDTMAAELLQLIWVPANGNPSTVDNISFTAYEINGVMNVPGKSTHSYTISAPSVAANGNNASVPFFENVSDGQAVSSAVETANGIITTRNEIFWNSGPVIGSYTASPGYDLNNFFVRRDVNIVSVTYSFGEENLFVFNNAGVQQTTSENNTPLPGVASSIDTVEQPAMTAYIRVSMQSPAGPDNIYRGGRFIDTGLIQTGKAIFQHGDYGGTFRSTHASEGKGAFLDSAAADRPWYSKSMAYIKGESDDYPVNNKYIYMKDSPIVHVGLDTELNGIGMNFISIHYEFDTYIAVHTKEEVNGSSFVYTNRGSNRWAFNGSGNVVSSIWTKLHHAPVFGATLGPLQTRFVEVENGMALDSMVITPAYFNDIIGKKEYKITNI